MFTVAPSAGVEWYCIVACDTARSGTHPNTLRVHFLCLGRGGGGGGGYRPRDETAERYEWKPNRTHGFSPRCPSLEARRRSVLCALAPPEVVRTLTVKHPSIRWMFSVLFISKSDCILINCGINKVLKGRKIKTTVTHKNKKNADGLTFAMCSFQGCVCFSFCYYGWHRPPSCPSFLPSSLLSFPPSVLHPNPTPTPHPQPPTCMWVQMRCNKREINWYKLKPHGSSLISVLSTRSNVRCVLFLVGMSSDVLCAACRIAMKWC